MIKLIHKGITLSIYISPPSKRNKDNKIIIQMFDKIGNTMSVGLDKETSSFVIRLLQKMETEI